MAARPDAQVLVISPDRLVREVIGGWLGLNGYHVHTAVNTGEALAAIPGRRIGLAILDLEYFFGTAVSVLEKIGRSLPDIPMVALTSGPDDASAVARCAGNGAVAALQKHGSLLSLRRAVENCLVRY